MKKKILFVNPYPENAAPSQRLKFEQYYPYFKEIGYEVYTSSFISNSFWKIIYQRGNFFIKALHTVYGYIRRISDLLTLRNYDIIYIHLWVTPFGPPVFEWLYKKVAKKIIYDIDDLVYLGNVESKAHPIVTWIKGRQKPIYLMKHADHVITCTPYLDNFVKKFNEHTTDISSTINTDLYIPKENYQVKDKLIIGWSGSHSTSKYLHLLDDVFKLLSQSNSFKLLVMGDPAFSITGVDVEAIPWKEEYEVEIIRSFDIGVYPLPEEEWVLGKSGLKALQYMALGIPTVATNIGTIHRIINNNENGFLVNNLKEWELVLLRLINDINLREKVGKKSVQTVEDKYSINSTKHIYNLVLNKVVDNPNV